MNTDHRPGSAPDPHALPPHLSIAKLAPEVLAKVGETYAAALFDLQRRLAELGRLAPHAQPVLHGALTEVTRLEQLGVRLQAIARELAGAGRAEAETIGLVAAARQALAARGPAAARRGVVLDDPAESAEPARVFAVAAVVGQLLDLALELALRIGAKVTVSAAVQGMPAHPVLMIRAERAATSVPEDETFSELQWLLFMTLARANGFAPQRLDMGRSVMLTLGFPPAAEVHGAAPRSAALLPRTPLATGRHVLVLEPHEITRVQAHRLLHDVGMVVDAVAGVEQARAALRDRVPDVLITGLPADDTACAALVDALRAAQPRLRVIELVDDDDAFALSLPGSEHAGQVGRATMARTLVQAVTQEVDAAWPG